jgi:PAS domain S-box-containing protein
MDGIVKQSDALRDYGLGEHCFRTLFEAVPDAIVVAGEEGLMVAVNSQTEKWFGYRRDQLLGRPVEMLIPARFELPYQLHRDQYLASPRERPAGEPLKLWVLRSDGVEMPVEIFLGLLISGRSRLVMSIIRDASERQKASQELARRAAELARSNADLDRFAYVASHDLREPLRKIQVFGSRLKVSVGEILGADERNYLDRMVAATARMESLIDAMLEYSRANQQPDRLELVDLGKTVSDVLEDLRVRIEYIRARVEVGALPAIRADPVMMRLLSQNLMTNALKFRKLVGSHVVRITGEEQDGEAHIWIEDNGVGFDPALSERIFDLFKRAHGRDRYDGTGIGLATCRKIVEHHGGRISGVGKPDEGAVFEVVLPSGTTARFAPGRSC